MPRVEISDQGSYLCNKSVADLYQNYGIKHKVSTPYHPQINGQMKVFNRKVKHLLQKLI